MEEEMEHEFKRMMQERREEMYEMGIVIKELCKHIKRSSKRSLIWTLEEGIHYITNRHWAVRYEELPREVLITMFSVFAKFPSEGTSLSVTKWGNHEQTIVSMKKIFDTARLNGEKGSITNIITDNGSLACKIIKTRDSIIRLDNNYMSMVEHKNDSPMCSGVYQPVSFCDNHLILLPIRSGDKVEEALINELIAG